MNLKLRINKRFICFTILGLLNNFGHLKAMEEETLARPSLKRAPHEINDQSATTQCKIHKVEETEFKNCRILGRILLAQMTSAGLGGNKCTQQAQHYSDEAVLLASESEHTEDQELSEDGDQSERELITLAQENEDKYASVTLLKHISSTSSNPSNRARAFLELGRIFFEGGMCIYKDIKVASAYFNSVAHQKYCGEARAKAFLYLALIDLESTETTVIERGVDQLQHLAKQVEFADLQQQALYYLGTLHALSESTVRLVDWNEHVGNFMRKVTKSLDNQNRAEKYFSLLSENTQVGQRYREKSKYARARLLEEKKEFKKAAEIYKELTESESFLKDKTDVQERLEKLSCLIKDLDDCITRATGVVKNGSMREALDILLNAERSCIDPNKLALIRFAIGRGYWHGGIGLVRNPELARLYFEKTANQHILKDIEIASHYFIALIDIFSGPESAIVNALDQLDHLTQQNHHEKVKYRSLIILAFLYMHHEPFTIIMDGIPVVTSQITHTFIHSITNNSGNLKKARTYLEIAVRCENDVSLQATAIHLFAILLLKEGNFIEGECQITKANDCYRRITQFKAAIVVPSVSFVVPSTQKKSLCFPVFFPQRYV